MIKIKTEVGIAIISAVILIVAISIVVGFDKTNKDLLKIEQSVQANQKALDGVVKKVPQK